MFLMMHRTTTTTVITKDTTCEKTNVGRYSIEEQETDYKRQVLLIKVEQI